MWWLLRATLCGSPVSDLQGLVQCVCDIADRSLTDCQVEVEATNGGQRWDGGEGEGDGLRLPGSTERKLLASRPVLRLTFSSAQEARRRTALLLIRTFRARSRDPVRLWNARVAVQHVQAIYIQAVFRGFLTRRWWRLVTEFLRRQLGTSFLEQRIATGDLISDGKRGHMKYGLLYPRTLSLFAC